MWRKRRANIIISIFGQHLLLKVNVILEALQVRKPHHMFSGSESNDFESLDIFMKFHRPIMERPILTAIFPVIYFLLKS